MPFFVFLFGNLVDDSMVLWFITVFVNKKISIFCIIQKNVYF